MALLESPGFFLSSEIFASQNSKAGFKFLGFIGDAPLYGSYSCTETAFLGLLKHRNLCILGMELGNVIIILSEESHSFSRFSPLIAS